METAPHLGFIWKLWKTDVPLAMLVKPGYLLCWAAKWHGEDEVFFRSINDPDMHTEIWRLLNEADAVVHFNGNEFDIPILNQEFVMEGISPPSPFKNIDLKKVVSKKFRLASNSLQYTTDHLLKLGGKDETGGFSTWVGCMNNDPEAWTRMEKYNKRDVVVTEEAYDRLLPWIDGHPNRNLYQEHQGCPNCGNVNLTKEGFAYTAMGKFQRYSCGNCGRWSRGTKRIEGVDYVGVR